MRVPRYRNDNVGEPMDPFSVMNADIARHHDMENPTHLLGGRPQGEAPLDPFSMMNADIAQQRDMRNPANLLRAMFQGREPGGSHGSGDRMDPIAHILQMLNQPSLEPGAGMNAEAINEMPTSIYNIGA
jgi:hypothetical protein